MKNYAVHSMILGGLVALAIAMLFALFITIPLFVTGCASVSPILSAGAKKVAVEEKLEVLDAKAKLSQEVTKLLQYAKNQTKDSNAIEEYGKIGNSKQQFVNTSINS